MSDPKTPAKKEDLSWYRWCGPLQKLLEDPEVTEIMCNGAYRIYIEKHGLLKKTAVQFKNDEQLISLMEAISKFAGRRLDRQNPLVDARLPDGSRVNCVVAPASVDGPALTIRKFSPFMLTHSQLIKSGVLDERSAYFLNCCVASRLNIVVTGGTGSGKTTLLNVLSSFIPQHERIVSIEDSAELKIKNENLVRLEAQPGFDGQTAVSINQLVRNALRMRPDRIIVGECRGEEAWDMLVAMNTGHEGSMTTLHSNSARESLRRLEGLILLGKGEMPLKAIREHIAGALDLIINIQRQADGSRKIVEILEVAGMESEVVLTQDLFRLQGGELRSLGFVPRFVKQFEEHGVGFPKDFFTDRYKVIERKKK